MKSDKNKKIVLASTIVLGIAAITSSALAAYIITGGDNHYETTSDPTDVLIDNRVTSLDCNPTDVELNFASTKTSTGRVRDDNMVMVGDVKTEVAPDFVVVLDLTMDANDKGYIPALSVTVTPSKEDTAGYLVVPAVGNITSADWNGESKPFTYKLTLTWKWGAAFGGVEPTKYFNEGGAGYSTPISDVVTTMEAFKKYVNGTAEDGSDALKYTIIIDQVA